MTSRGRAGSELSGYVDGGLGEIADGGSVVNDEIFWKDVGKIDKMLAIEFVMVLGIARRNHKPRPLINPLPSALTISLTIRPSSLATIMLNTVLRIRKHECRTTSPDSEERHDGIATRKRMERSWDRNARSMLGLTDSGESRSGKCGLSAVNLDLGVSLMETFCGSGEI